MSEKFSEVIEALNPFTLEGKTILITGASSGIGRASAILCSQMGARVIITGRNERELEITRANLEGKNHEIIIVDLRTGGGVKLLTECSPEIDGLVNNAGIVETLPVDFVSEDKLEKVFAVNTCAPVLIFEELIASGKLRNGSSVVFTSSIDGNGNYTMGNSVYSASKAGISEYVKHAAVMYGEKNIRVNAVCPGMTETNLLRDNKVLNSEVLAENAKKYPLKRHARPEEIANAIVYLLSGASSYVTGINLVVDGGFTLSH